MGCRKCPIGPDCAPMCVMAVGHQAVLWRGRLWRLCCERCIVRPIHRWSLATYAFTKAMICMLFDTNLQASQTMWEACRLCNYFCGIGTIDNVCPMQTQRARPASTPACAWWAPWMVTPSPQWRAWAIQRPASTKCKASALLCPTCCRAGGSQGDVHAFTAMCCAEAFASHHASQCGYCTPGFVVATHAALERCRAKGVPATPELLMQGLDGNLCRCTGYRPILDACRARLLLLMHGLHGRAVCIHGCLHDSGPSCQWADTCKSVCCADPGG